MYNRSQFIAGIVLVVVAVLIILFVERDGSPAGAAAIGALGVITIATSGRR